MDEHFHRIGPVARRRGPSGLGLFLRLAGPLLQVACLIALFASRAAEARVAGVRVASVLYAGFFLGFALVVVGLVLSRRR